MTYIEGGNSRLSRRELLKDVGRVAFASTLVGSAIYLIYSSSEDEQRKENTDYYKGVVLEEYAKGSFEITKDNSALYTNPLMPHVPFKGEIMSINSEEYADDFYIINPGIIRGRNPESDRLDEPYIVLNAMVNVRDTSNMQQEQYIKQSQLLYAYVPDLFERKNVRFVPLVTNKDGTHSDAAKHNVARGIGRVDYPGVYVPMLW